MCWRVAASVFPTRFQENSNSVCRCARFLKCGQNMHLKATATCMFDASNSMNPILCNWKMASRQHMKKPRRVHMTLTHAIGSNATLTKPRRCSKLKPRRNMTKKPRRFGAAHSFHLSLWFPDFWIKQFRGQSSPHMTSVHTANRSV